ncbi:MAG: outer membrane lipoprotein-sorting protein [Limisphaerales bacterium]
MSSFRTALALRLACFSLMAGAVGGSAAAAGGKTAAQQGEELVRELRELRPIEGGGMLRLRNPDGKWTAAIPVKVGVDETAGSWTANYEAFGPDGRVSETLAIMHETGKPRVYLHAAATGGPRRLTGDEASVPFAGSEFWLSDLGLEFLQWPEHRVVKREMRKGRSCRVVESINPNPGQGGYARVLSWVDVEHRGILRAEAYDADRRLVKEFSIGSFKKVPGEDGESRWQLKSMEIRNEQSDARTRLAFDLSLRD